MGKGKHRRAREGYLLGMPAPAPDAFARSRELMAPAMLEAVERLSPRISRVVTYHLGWVDAEGNSVERPAGKAVRPALAFACAEAVGSPAEAAIPGAVAVELVHNFSLLHDDVMDRDTERRHQPTAWALMGVGEAILAGDALLALAQERLIDPPAPERLKAAAALSEATADMITGQAEDLSFETRDDVGFDECVAMLQHKTAALLACACKVGAILGGGTDDQVATLGEFGRSLGLAFQAVDDVLGIWGKPETTGKPAWSDLRQKKKTLPVVAALTRGGPAAEGIRQLLTGDMSEEDIALAAKLVEENGGREQALEVASRGLAEALERLDRLHISSRPRAELVRIAEFITDRDF